MPRNLRVVVQESEAAEEITPDQVREIEELFADLFFQTWLEERGVTRPPAEKAKAAA